MSNIAENYSGIMERVKVAAGRVGRDPQGISVVAVSKFNDVERIREAAQAGLTLFGESRLQEAQTKLPQIAQKLEWHFIGALQTNKARAVAQLFDVVQSVDSLRLAEKLSALAQELGKTLRVYAQVNISQEPQKHGFSVSGGEKEIVSLGQLPHLKLEGLMGMAAASADPEMARSSFKALYQMRQRISQDRQDLNLSMGMSHDFEVAIEEGADLVRIGTALFK